MECLIATNAGEPLKPLHEIASGGEMSRVMLALKVTVEEAASGGAGRKKKIRSAADAGLRRDRYRHRRAGGGGGGAEAEDTVEGQQVLCITHLPQIAAFADQHF